MARLNFGSVISHSLSPARSIINIASSMRDVYSDFEVMVIDSITSDTTALCKKPHWPVSIMLPVRAGSTTKYLQPGQKVVVRWEDGDPNRRFIDAKTRLRALTADEIAEVILSSNWRTWMADYLRWNSWTEETLFDWTTAAEEAGPGPVGTTMHGRLELPPALAYPYAVDISGDLFGYGARSYAESDAALNSQGVHNLENGSVASWNPPLDIPALLDDNSITYEFFGIPSLCRIEGWGYAEIAVYNTDPETSEPIESIYVCKFNAARFGEPQDIPEAVYIKLLCEGPGVRMDGQDIIVTTLTVDDVPVKRLVLFANTYDEAGEETGEITCYHCDEETGEDVVSFAVPLAFVASFPEHFGEDVPRTRSDGTGQIWISDGIDTALVGITVDAGGVAWSTDDLSLANTEGFALMSVNGSQVSVWSSWRDVETITDSLLIAHDKDLWGNPASVDRTEAAAGHSYHQGVLVLNASSGAYVARNDAGGTPVFEDYQQGTKTATKFEDSFSYAIPRGLWTVDNPDGPGTIEVPGPVDNLVRVLRVPNYQEFFYKNDLYPEEDHGPSNNPYLISAVQPGSPSETGYSYSDTAAAPYLATVQGLIDDWVAYQTSWVDNACLARDKGFERAQTFRTQITFPKHPLRDSSDNRSYMDLTFVSVDGINEPQVFPLEPEPRMGVFFGSDMANTFANFRSPPAPRVPEDDTQTSQIVAGVPQRWRHFEEYLPYLGAPDKGPFDGLYSVESGNDYSGSYSWSGFCGDAAEGDTMVIVQGVIWEGEPEYEAERTRTPDPHWCAIGAFDGTAWIHGPRGGEAPGDPDPVPRPLVWARRLGAGIAATYEYASTDQWECAKPVVITAKADPMDAASQRLSFTFIRSGASWKCVILDAALGFVGDPDTPDGLGVGAWYDGELNCFWSADMSVSWRWTP